MDNYKHTVEQRFIRYAKIDTEADPNSNTFPSSMKQKDLGKVLVDELLKMGISDAEMDEWGYVFGTIPSNCEINAPTICYCAHMDTAPDCSGKDVKPIVHRNYQGQDLVLPDDKTQIIKASDHPYLTEKIGEDIITASGLTLLGADDKAGVAIIMDFANYMMNNPEAIHGDIRLLFTPDEEIGRGVDHLDMKKLNADYGYTLDSGMLGMLDEETFSADGASFIFKGISAHPGYAKNKLVHAIKVASSMVDSLPKNEWSPETTHELEGFVHPTGISGGLEEAKVDFIIRDHDTKMLPNHIERLEKHAKDAVSNFPGSSYTMTVSEQYRNMKDILKEVPFVVDYASEAMKNIGIEPRKASVRGGTDGSRLSFMGLPCPNLFTGEMAFHSKHEYCSVQDMEKSVKTLVKLSEIWTGHQK
ncbi:MAG: peptidase T [Crocinitomicaceae bacterium]|nr:peptidase T [Crocinitomicaceae bacterium]